MKEDSIIDTKRRLWKEANFQWQDFDGNSGGLMTLWDPITIIPRNSPFPNRLTRYIHSTLYSAEHNFEFVLTNLYAPNNVVERCQIFNLLTEDRKLFPNIPWPLMGDFNTLLHHYKNFVGLRKRKVIWKTSGTS